jgi:hypothetical protein
MVGLAERANEVPPGNVDVPVSVQTGALRRNDIALELTVQRRQLVPRNRRLGVMRVMQVVVEVEQRHHRAGLDDC